MALQRVVVADEDGRRADVLLAAWLDEPRARAQARLRAGQVTVDGRPVGKARRLRAGERVSVADPPPPPPAPAPAAVPLRYADDHLAVVAKPAGMVVHGGAGVRQGTTLVDALRAMGVPLAGDAAGAGPDGAASQEPRPGIVHRLDRGTSGLLVVASSEPARAGLVAMFQRHAVQRRYQAIVDGVPRPPSATVDAPILRARGDRTRFTVAAGGRRAVTHYDVVDAFGRAALLTVALETGRTHQVRVHLAAVGHPVSGDTAYGASRALRDELGLRRPALHAGHLAFDHPVTGERITVEEPLPEDMRAALDRLRRGTS